MQKITHIVTNESNQNGLIESFAINPDLSGEIVSLNDWLAVGPIAGLDTPEGLEKRSAWIHEVLLKSDTEMIAWWKHPEKEDLLKLASLKALPSSEKRILWMGNNTHDQLTLARLVHVLQPTEGDLWIVAVSESIVKMPRGNAVVPDSMVVLNIEQIAEVGKTARLLSDTEIKESHSLWNRLSAQEGAFRLSDQHGYMDVRPENWLDAKLLSLCTKEFTRAVRIIGNGLFELNFEVSDTVLNWRLKELCRSGELQYTGPLAQIRDYNVKLKD